MKILLCLFLYIGLGVALLLVPNEHLGVMNGTMVPPLSLWAMSLTSFAIPACLFVLSFTKSTLVRLLDIGWGAWMAIITLWLLVQGVDVTPMATLYGKALVAFTFILSLALILFGMVDLTKSGEVAPLKKK